MSAGPNDQRCGVSAPHGGRICLRWYLSGPRVVVNMQAAFTVQLARWHCYAFLRYSLITPPEAIMTWLQLAPERVQGQATA